ncbi:DarT ssDNA thymidine ADP-ribosyltransferase family protein [Agromyces sp. NPDC058110]|uniref:DarT ssDNA thymidine ADP-ribosyltransferase family protein n=1 Tax=Agromyces sp. NPDC058110 TaxID=3346345 RepID=UPI0036DD5CA1
MCATCFPPPEPAAKPATATVRAPRTTTSVRGGTTRTSTRPPARVPGARAVATHAPIDPKTVRIYHVTHVENLASIFGAGAILADTAGAEPEVDLSAPAAREFRRSAPVEGTDHVVADYVPFLLSTDAHVWESLRTGSPDPRLAAGATARPASDHVLFVTSIEKAVGARTEQVGAVAVTGADVAATGSVVDSAWPDVLRALQRIHRDDDGAQLASAEFLVHDALPLERVLLIAVGNDRVRDRVKAVLDAFDLRTRVAVHPPYFQPNGGAVSES